MEEARGNGSVGEIERFRSPYKNTTSIGPSYVSKSVSLVYRVSHPTCSREAAIPIRENARN
jgi:hypothetical protein